MKTQEEFSEAVNDGMVLVSGENKLYMNTESGTIHCVGPGFAFSGVNLRFSDDENFVHLIGRRSEVHGVLFIPDWEVEA